MKQHEVDQVLQEARAQFRSVHVHVDTTHARPDGKGYRVALRYAGRCVTVGKLSTWDGMKEAWLVLAER